MCCLGLQRTLHGSLPTFQDDRTFPTKMTVSKMTGSWQVILNCQPLRKMWLDKHYVHLYNYIFTTTLHLIFSGPTSGLVLRSFPCGLVIS